MFRNTLCLLFVLNSLVFASQSDKNTTSQIINCFDIKVTAADQKNQPAMNVINGSGIINDLSDNRWASMWATTPNGNGGGSGNPHPGTSRGATWIKFDFNKIYNLREMWVWNYNEHIERGLKNVVIEYTADGKKWEKLGDYVFAQAPGTINYSHNTVVDFNDVAVKSVIITAKEGTNIGNYGDGENIYGLGEVRFYAAPDPCETESSKVNMGPPAKLRLKLERGIVIDRQLHSIPPQPRAVIFDDDIPMIKSLGFEFVKLIINPQYFISGSTINSSNMWYLDKIVNQVVNENLPAVICIHPEADFKLGYLGNYMKFEDVLGFYEDLAAYMAKRWNPDQLAFQIMTEPFGASSNLDDWNCWDALQRRIWKVVRQKMPEHTLILSGDLAGQIEGVLNIKPVNDENVMYSFTFYESHFFTFQGGPWQHGGKLHLKNLPYPSSPEILKSMQEFLAPVPEQFRKGIQAEIEQYANENWNRERLKSRIERLVAWNEYYGNGKLKIWCAEFGCFEAAKPEGRAQYIEDLRTLFEENNFGWAYWSYNEAFTIMTSDRTFGPASEQVPDKRILSALLPDKHRFEKTEEQIVANDAYEVNDPGI